MLRCLAICGASVPRFPCTVHQLVVKKMCNDFHSVAIPICNSDLKNSSKNCSTYVNSLSNTPVSFAREMSNKLGVDHDSLMNLVVDCPNLLSIRRAQWEEFFRELTNHGFTAEDTMHMLTKYPGILELKTHDLKLSFEIWRGTKMGEKLILSLLKSCPHYMLLSEREIATRIPHLKALGSSKGLITMLKGAPNIMLENWNSVVAKLSFLKEEMRVESTYILNSFALNRSLMFLKTRFVFLERCGKYVKPKLNADSNAPTKNPSLRVIIESSDETFATRVAGVTLEEYEAFQELYAMEVENSDISDSDSE